MKKQLFKKVILIILTQIFVISASGCQWFTLEDEQRVELDNKTFSIYPTTLLQSLAHNNKNTFVLQTATPPATPYWSSLSEPWKQSDYLFIAQAFHQFVSGQSLDGWGLEKMTFNTECEKVSEGLQEGGFTFFRTEHFSDNDSHLIHFIYISQWLNEVDFESAETFYHALGEYPSLDLSKIKISAEQALQIAESAGGSKFRKDWENDCVVRMSIESAGKYRGWLISYSPNDPQKPHFWITVNETTGEYLILW